MPPTYHVLLIGIDKYPFGYRSLRGCVNDIDAVEQLLLEAPGVGIPAGQIRVTRLAAPHEGAVTTSRFAAETQWPTKANVVAALQKLAGPEVQPADRVLIFYAGHGDDAAWTGSNVWHEMLVPNDPESNDIQPLFDVEVNLLISAIAARTQDLTVVLDCCHSAGATRDLEDGQAEENVRMLGGPARIFAPPNLAALGPATLPAGSTPPGILQHDTPTYLVAVACQADEAAKESAAEDGAHHGVFTRSLVSLLAGLDADQRARLRWGDIWTQLLAGVARHNPASGKPSQHPWVIGERARRIFGGPWQPMDLGLPIRQLDDDTFQVEAGTLTGVTVQAELAVYGPEPLRFAPIGDPADQPIGRLRVLQAGPARCTAETLGASFSLPLGARARLVEPGASQRLQVRVRPAGARVPKAVSKSPLLARLDADEAGAEVYLTALPDGRWQIGNEVEPAQAIVPAGEAEALRAGLESCYRYQTVMRLARRSIAPELAGSLVLRLLDCNDQATLAALSPEALADPQFPEAPRDDDRIYALPQGYRFCVHLSNRSQERLQVALFVCTAGGVVDLLSDAVLRKGADHVLWLDGQLGTPMAAFADPMPVLDPSAPLPPFVTDRLIVVGTTRRDANLRHLIVEETVQQVVDANLSKMTARGDDDRGMRGQPRSSAPAELWTATIVPVRILHS